MAWVGVPVALVLIMIVFVDTFEAMILPRRVAHDFRLARLYFQTAWKLWVAVAGRLPTGRRRTAFLSIFGPLSLFGLLFVWAMVLIVGFALLHWSLGTNLSLPRDTDDRFTTYLYFSGTTFFTLGFGDVVATGSWGRTLSVAEAGIGFGFLAVVISYLPILYQGFSRREIIISLLDARAGSPPSAGELLRRIGEARALASMGGLLSEWEHWAAELLESHLSYAVLRFYRCQHDNQSWVSTLTTILDTSALLIAAVDSPIDHQARLTFAMARHAAVDLAMVSQTPPLPLAVDRLAEAERNRLWTSLREAGLVVREETAGARALTELRALYEPFVNALAQYYHFTLPALIPEKPPVDNWQTSAWTSRSPGLGGLPTASAEEDHFD